MNNKTVLLNKDELKDISQIDSKFKPIVRKICEISNTHSAENTDENNLSLNVTSDLLSNSNLSNWLSQFKTHLTEKGSSNPKGETTMVLKVFSSGDPNYRELGTHHLLRLRLNFPRRCCRMRPARYLSICLGPGPPTRLAPCSGRCSAGLS